MSEPATEPAAEPAAAELTPEELAVAHAALTMFETMAACEQAGGDANRAYLAAIPPELLAEAKRQFPLLGFLGL